MVSVVTPVYNTGEYLAECIESVLGQTYTAFEYVILDNCSTDDSYAIAKEYESRDDRVKVFRNRDFLTQRENYNAALSLISDQSDFTKMVQADDWLYPQCLAEMVRVAARSDEIEVVCALQVEGRKVLGAGLPPEREVYPGEVPCREYFLRGNSVFGNPTSMLFRSESVRSRTPFYDETSYTEDVDVCFELLDGKSFGFVHQVLGYLRLHEGSVTSELMAYDPWPLHHLMLFERYGHKYLTEDELRSRRRVLRYNYCHVLGRGILKRQGRAFREYQAEGFRQMDARITISWIIASLLVTVADYVFNLKANVESRWMR